MFIDHGYSCTQLLISYTICYILAHLLLLETMDHLIMSTVLLKEFVYCGGLIYLLEILVRAPSRRVREAVARLLSHCLVDKQLGRRIQAIVTQYLPPIFTDTLRDTPEAFFSIFDCEFI